MIDFKNIQYLKHGNSRQKAAYSTLKGHNVFEKLADYDPILTGTIPISIDLPESDLDIICSCPDPEKFSIELINLFGNEKNLQISAKTWNGLTSIIAQFQLDGFEIEIFAQNKPTNQQNAYRHMIMEYQILTKMGSEFRDEIIKLKQSGIKTEPAFAQLLKLSGDPYSALLNVDLERL